MYTTSKFAILASAILTVGFLLHLTSAQKQTETWHDSPDASTTKIRLMTALKKNDLQYQLIKKVQDENLTIDQASSVPGHLWSTIATWNNYSVRFLVESTDSVGIISGQVGNVVNVAGTPPTSAAYSWTPITFNGNGWIQLTQFMKLDTIISTVVQFNSTKQ